MFKELSLFTAFLSIVSVSATWFQHGDIELYVEPYNQPKTWQDARKFCMKEGGDLATLSDPIVTSLLMERANGSNLKEYWIGYNKIMKDTFSWSNGDQNIEENWAPGYPIKDPDFACAYVVKRTQGQWYNSRCSVYKDSGYFCQRNVNYTRPMTDPPTPQVPGYCPQGYFNVDNANKCYKVYTPDDTSPGWTWHEALATCEKSPGNIPTLGIVNNEKEAWAALSGTKDKRVELWIGLRRENKNEEFRWITNEIMTSYKPWGSSSNKDDTCGYMTQSETSPQWRDDNCNARRGFLCQTYKDPNLVISTTPQSEVVCPDGYFNYWYGCYRYYQTNTTWDNALKQCEQEGSTLLTIHYRSELAAVLAFRQVLGEKDKNPSMIWMGLHYDNQLKIITWTDNWAPTYENWGSSEPKTANGHCVNMNQKGQWFMRNCNEKQPYICKYTTVAPLTTHKQIEGECPNDADWIPYGSYCYSFDIGSYTYTKAMDKCFANGATLASIHHPYLNNMLVYEASDSYSSRDLWIGFHRGKAGAFQWIDSSSVEYVNWKSGDPKEGDCATLLAKDFDGGEWTAKDCEYEASGYICQIEKVVSAVTPPVPHTRCPDEEWESWGEFCYLFQSNRLSSWENAEQTCATRGGDQNGHIASVHGLQENRHIIGRLDQLSTLPFHMTYWIGLRRNITIDKWFWHDGTELIYQNWDSRNNGPYGAGCVELDSSSGLWNRQNCDQPLGFVCRATKAPLTEDKDNDKEEANKGLTGGETAGLVIGALAIVAVFIALNALMIMRYRRQVATSSALRRRTSVSSGVSAYSNTSGTSKTALT